MQETGAESKYLGRTVIDSNRTSRAVWYWQGAQHDAEQLNDQEFGDGWIPIGGVGSDQGGMPLHSLDLDLCFVFCFWGQTGSCPEEADGIAAENEK